MFFIVGMPRSGTTLLAERLARLPDVAVSRETHFYPHHWRRFQGVDAGDRADLDGFLRTVVDDEAFRYGGVPDDLLRAVRDRLLSGDGLTTATDVLGALLTQLESATGLIGEKTPQHLEWVPTILQEAATARVVVIVRDPRAVSLSLSEVSWGSDDPAVHAARWRVYAELTQELVRLHPRAVQVIRYEDLVARSDEVLERIAAHLGGSVAGPTPFEEGARTFDPEDEPWKVRATQPLDASRAERWRRELATDAWAILETHCKASMRTFGYALEKPIAGYLRAASWRAQRTLRRERLRHQRRLAALHENCG